MILHEIHAEGMTLSETFQVAAIIEKLPPVWKDFKNYLKHKRKEMKIEDLIVRLRIEEDNKGADRKVGNTVVAKANVVEHGQSSIGKKKFPSDKRSKLGPKGGISKKPKFQFQRKCYNCGKTGHRASECRLPQKKFKKNQEANMTEVDYISRDVSDINLSAVVSKVNLVGSNPREL